MLNEQLQTEIEQEAKDYTNNYNPRCYHSDIDAAYKVAANKYAEKWQEAEQRADRYEKALKDIASGKALPHMIAQFALTPKTGSDGTDK